MHLTAAPAAANTFMEPADSAIGTPQNQFQVRSELNLPHRFEWDNSAEYVGKLAVEIPAYTRVDTRIGWKANEYLDFSLIGQNLLTPRHAEFRSDNGLNYTLVERSVFAKITWRF